MRQLINEDNLLLGKHTDYPRQYNPTILQAIPRALGRESLPLGLNVGRGFDCWHLYELSWLDANDRPKVAIARVLIPADSPNIVESKSLKLYCNGLNFCHFDTSNDVLQTLKKDIANVVKATVKVNIIGVDDLMPSMIFGKCIDMADLNMIAVKTALAGKGRQCLLKHRNQTENKVTETLYSHLLRSNCPVTSQPDWGSLMVKYDGKAIDHNALLNYIASFREHNGFHEQCVEQIYADIVTILKPEKLLVQAWYTRRGGIDINPCRVLDKAWLPKPSRLVRQ